MTSRDLSSQPLLQRTLAGTAASPENLVPPHNRNQTLGGIILCLPAQRKNSAETINLQTIATRDTMTSRDLPNQALLRRTLAATAASPENLVPPHNQNQTRGDIILCLPAQRKNSAEIINLQSQHLDSLGVNPQWRPVTFWTSCHRCRMQYEYLTIFVNQELLCHKCELPFVAIEIPAPKADVLKPLSVSVPDPCPTKFAACCDSRTAAASSGRDAQVKKVDDALHQNTITPFTASSSGVEGKQTMKKRRFGTKNPFPKNPYAVGNTGVPSQSNLPRRPKELPRNDIRRILMDKARTEILGYLND